MIEPETGYNTHEEIDFSQCYCHVLGGKHMCQRCIEDLAKLGAEEAYGCYCEADNMCNFHRGTMNPHEAFRLGYELATRRKQAA